MAEGTDSRGRVDPGVLDHAQVSIIVTDLTGTILECNRYAEVLFGRPREELLGADSGSFAAEAVPPELAAEIGRRLSTGKTWEGDFRVRHADGSVSDVHAIDSPLFDADGRLDGVISVAMDITGRRRAERRLAAQYAATRALAEATTLAEATGRVLPMVCEALGWQHGALWELDESGTELQCVEVWHAPEISSAFADLSRQYRFVPGVGLPGRVWSSDAPVWIRDVTHADNFPRAPAAAESGLRGAFGIPLRGAGGDFLGVLEFFGTSVEEPDPELLEPMQAVGTQVGQFMQRRRWEEAVEVSERALRQSRERLAHLASTLLESLVPSGLPEIPGVEVAAAYRPGGAGERVGGDFYDVFERARRDWAVVIGDVCGKGPEAASLTALARYTIRAAAMRTTRPRVILSTLGEAILRQHVDRFCTAVYCRIRLHDGSVRVTLCAAGHPPPLLVRPDGSVERVGAVGRLLGVVPDCRLVDTTLELHPGDLLVLYTDGVTDARGPDGRFGDSRLARVLRGLTGCSAEAVVAAVDDAVREFSADATDDDVALVAIRAGGE
jgi:sigma-B regulation protein RsbU (phosphoserine phosphatase)